MTKNNELDGCFFCINTVNASKSLELIFIINNNDISLTNSSLVSVKNQQLYRGTCVAGIFANVQTCLKKKMFQGEKN